MRTPRRGGGRSRRPGRAQPSCACNGGCFFFFKKARGEGVGPGAFEAGGTGLAERSHLAHATAVVFFFQKGARRVRWAGRVRGGGNRPGSRAAIGCCRGRKAGPSVRSGFAPFGVATAPGLSLGSWPQNNPNCLGQISRLARVGALVPGRRILVGGRQSGGANDRRRDGPSRGGDRAQAQG